MLQSMPILYTRWRIPEAAQSFLPELESAHSVGAKNNFNWLEAELARQKSRNQRFLVADHPTAADVMVQFSVQFIFARGLGVKADGSYPEVEAWLKRTEETEGYRAAVAKTGYDLFKGDFRK